MSKLITELAYLQRGLYVDKEFLKIINPILRDDQVQEMRKVMHHGYIDTLSHSLQVAYMSYRIGKKLGLDYRSLARAGLLHEFHVNDRASNKSLEQTTRIFLLNKKEREIIKWHIWPLNIGWPLSKESWVMILADNYCTAMEYLRVAPLQLRLYP